MYNNLPGVQVKTVDGGLIARRTPRTKSTIIIGTAAKGQADTPYQVVDRAQAALDFDFDGNLIRAMEEAAAFCDNLYLYRIGTQPGTFTGLGKDTAVVPAAIGTPVFDGDGIDDLTKSGTFTGLANATYTIQITKDDAANGPAAIGSPDFTGVGLDDLTKSGTFTGQADATFTVVITTAAGTDKFKWKKNSGALSGEVSITGASQLLTEGVSVTFGATTGHTMDDAWTIAATIEVDDPDCFQWKKGSGAFSGDVTITGAAQLLADGISVTFEDTTDHTLNDVWTIAATIEVDQQCPGFDLTLGERTSDAGSRYKVWSSGAGVFYLWLDGNLVYANDVSAGVVVDTNDTAVTGSSTGGLPVGAQGDTAKTLDGAITLSAAAALSPSGGHTTPDYTSPVTGIGLTARETYIALQKAYDLLENFSVSQVHVPGAILNNPNVAFYVANDAATAVHNPATNADALDWLHTTADVLSLKTFHWASESVDSDGNGATPATLASPTNRLAQGYHEVSFGYQLARFCAKQSEVLGGCLGFIGCSGPLAFNLTSIRDWVGFLPIYNSDGSVKTSGRGLLGISYMVGCTNAVLNSLCHDAASYRQPGFFQTTSGEYDGGSQLDRNQNRIDVGAYLHVVGETALIVNGYGTYMTNIAGVVAGLHSALDPKSALTNKPLTSAVQLYKASLGQLDSLTFAKINMLRFKGPGQTPVLLHGLTSATVLSDYISLLRQDIKFLVTSKLFTVGDRFIGESSVDGLQLQAMQTALDAELMALQKAGYLQRYSFTVSTTEADQRIGHASIDVSFMPADELVQLNATVGIKRR